MSMLAFGDRTGKPHLQHTRGGQEASSPVGQKGKVAVLETKQPNN